MTDRTQLHHLADRARRGVLLPAEGALLADAVDVLLDRAEGAEAARDRLLRSRDRQADRAKQAEARVAELEEEVVNAQQDNEFMKLLVAASSKDGHTVRCTAQKLATLEHVRALAAEWGEPGHCSWLSASVLVRQLRDALDAVPDPGTVTITQARHTALTAGQCTHYLDTHQQHHTEPVANCPYPGCWEA